jgi:membrane-bound serine protease (ClpP class)
MHLQKVLLTVLFVLGFAAGSAAQQVCFIKIEGAIGPATANYIARAIDAAAAQSAQCLIIQLDTPGGLLDSTKVIVQKFLASPLPTVVYVAPPGASAGSAGCFITLAADVAAMAPTTNIGAAHPVTVGGGGGPEKPDDTMKQKLESYAISYIETIAARRNRNVEWAKQSVRESASLPSEKALELKVIDIVAADLADLRRQLDGRQVQGKVLKTAAAQVVDIPMNLRERVFQMIWHPSVMFILMLIVMYGIIGELSNPGAILPGVVGTIALILVLYMSAVLPVNIAGLALIGLAIGLFVIDIFAPTHGILTVGGTVAFFLGSMMLFDRSEPLYRLSLAFIIPGTLLTAAFFTFIVGAGLRAQSLPVTLGKKA